MVWVLVISLFSCECHASEIIVIPIIDHGTSAVKVLSNSMLASVSRMSHCAFAGDQLDDGIECL